MPFNYLLCKKNFYYAIGILSASERAFIRRSNNIGVPGFWLIGMGLGARSCRTYDILAGSQDPDNFVNPNLFGIRASTVANRHAILQTREEQK